MSSSNSPAYVLFRQVADGQLTAEEFCAFEQRLATDAVLRADFVRFMDTEACLYEELSVSPAPVIANPQQHLRRTPRFRVLAFAVTCCSALLLAAVVWLNLAPSQQPSRFLESGLRGVEYAAVVTHVTDIRQDPHDEPLKVGTRLKPGVLELRQGELQIDFLGGTRLLLKAPAELHVLSNSSATIVSGSVAARVTEGAGKFVLGAPDAAMVNLGTEFAVNVDARGDSDVHVYRGEVEVSLLGPDGNTLSSQQLLQKETVHVDRASRTVRPINTNLNMFAAVRDLDRSRLNVTPAYVNAVRRSKPVLYWRFEETQDGRIRNEVQDRYAAHIVADATESSAITIGDGVAHFSTSGQPRYLQADDLLQAINHKAFSIELWINSETLHWGTIVNLMAPGMPGSESHLGLIELAHNTRMVHNPSVVRYLHRHPPGNHTWGLNLFGANTCTPGQWTQIVSVKEPNQLRLFVNGVQVRTVLGVQTAGSDDDPYMLTIGQFGTSKPQRQFQGLLDEMAIYDRALSEVEISEHYWTMMTTDKPERPPVKAKSPTAARRAKTTRLRAS